MISQSVITASLIGIVLTGVIPVIGGLVLLAMGKIKGSSFWAGILACIIGTIVALIPSAVIGVASGVANAAQNGNAASTEVSFGMQAAVQIIVAICFALAMGICIKSCMKLRTFKAALSCGLGFAAVMAVSSGITCASLYTTFGTINSGTFEQQYAQYMQMGVFTKEMVAAMKEQFTVYTAADMYQTSLTALFLGAALAASGVLIMSFVCKKKAFVGMCAAAGIIAACSIASILPNAAAAIIVSGAIGAAAMVFALRVKDDIAPPAAPSAADDPFMAAVEDAQKGE